MRSLLRPAALFLAIGLALYAALYYAAELLVERTGHSNPFFKIEAAQKRSFDWVILGASHAMPLDFADFNAWLEGETRLAILNLASPGTGPLYNRFVLEEFLRGHGTRNVLYVADSFAFYSRAWNEERFADSKLLARTPFVPAVARRLSHYAWREGVDPRALLDYASGFSKINNRERFRPDLWEGEAQFERVHRPSAAAVKKRVAYLYPDPVTEAALARYLGELARIATLARQAGARMVVIKMPVPQQFAGALPNEAAFDAALARVLSAHGVCYADFSTTVNEPRFYFDTDHLNRAGLTAFVGRSLKALLVSGACAAAMAPGPGAAQPIEDELVLITPVGKSLSDPALAEFRKLAKQRWNVDVKTSALSAGTPVAYGRIVEWAGRPQADLFWGGESALYDRLAAQNLLAPLGLPKAVTDAIPQTLGKPKPVSLKDPKGYWIGTVLESTGIAYHPRLLARLGVPPPKDWDDLLDPRLKGHIAQTPPTRSSSSHAAYEVILQRDGEERGWEWAKRLAANTGIFAPRSRDVPSMVARGEFAVGFSVPSYFAFEDRLAGFDIKYVAPKTAWITSGPAAILKGAKHPNAARAFIEFLLSDRGQRIAAERGLFPIVPKFRIEGPPGSTAEMAVGFNGGVRSYYDIDIVSVYDDAVAQKRYEEVNARFRREIESVAEELKRKY